MTRRIAGTRRIAVGGATLALAAGFGWVGTGAASAATPSVSCKTTNAFATFTPGVDRTPTQQKETLSGKLSGCTGKVKIAGGSIAGNLNSPGPIQCSSLLGGTVGTGNEVLRYSDGTSSTAKVSIVAQSKNGAFTINGSITKGRFAGHKVTGAMVLNRTQPTNPGANCGLASPEVKITRINFSGTTTVS